MKFNIRVNPLRSSKTGREDLRKAAQEEHDNRGLGRDRRGPRSGDYLFPQGLRELLAYPRKYHFVEF